MAIGVVFELPGVTEAQYATARELLGQGLQNGNLVHVAGPTEDGWRVVEVWESPEAMGAFFQSPAAGAAFQAAGVPPVAPQVFPVYALASATYPGT